MKAERIGWTSKLAKFTKMLLLWVMLISGIVLATRQARAVELNFSAPFPAPILYN